MSLDDRLYPISTLAKRCLASFGQCLQDTLGFGNPRYSTIEDEMARFSIWISNMAVLDIGKDGLNYRTRESPEVQRLILGILEILQEYIEECSGYCDFKRISEGISSEVGLLHELSSTIRQASRASPDVKAITSLQMINNHGSDVEDLLKENFTQNLRDCFPESSDAIRYRLATTMILRAKRVLYRRSLYPWSSVKSILIQPDIEPEIETQIISPLQETQERNVPIQDINPVPVPALSALSSAKSVNSRSYEELIFPPCPKIPGHSIIKMTCPYCLHVLSNLEVSDEEKWRRHIVEDLDALICLFDACDEPNILYRNSSDWLLHMRKHVRRWRCSAKAHGVQSFNSRDEYEMHLEETHKKKYSNTELDILSERASCSSGPLFDFCPLCGIQDEANNKQTFGNLLDHINDHLKSIALRSLPPYSDRDSYNNYNEASIRPRSTVNKVFINLETFGLLEPQPLLVPKYRSYKDIPSAIEYFGVGKLQYQNLYEASLPDLLTQGASGVQQKHKRHLVRDLINSYPSYADSQESTTADNDEPEHFCEICYKAFYREDKLDLHMEKHRPKIIYCLDPRCEFHLGADSHNLSHDAQRGQRHFEKRMDYMEHLKTAHNATPYPCPIAKCKRVRGNGYRTLTGLENHLKYGHNAAPEDSEMSNWVEGRTCDHCGEPLQCLEKFNLHRQLLH